jgi:AbrB family looped-hinge helix DNA binding protein
MNELRVGKGYRLFLPKQVREILGVKSGDKIRVEVRGRGIFVLERAHRKVSTKKPG